MVSYIVITVAVLISGGVVFLTLANFYNEKKQKRLAEENEFYLFLVKQINKKGKGEFNIHAIKSEFGVSDKIAETVVIKLFENICLRVYDDQKVTPEERARLDNLIKILEIDTNRALQVEESIKIKSFAIAAQRVIGSGAVSSKDADDIKKIRIALGIKKPGHQIIGQASLDGYIALFKEVIKDGRVTQEEITSLQNYRTAFDIDKGHANLLIKKEALSLYRLWFTNIVQDGEISANEENILAFFRQEFSLTPEETNIYDSQIANIKKLYNWRNGNLPVIGTKKILEAGETPHFDGACTFEWETANKSHFAEGELFITSDRVIFTSTTKRFDFSPKRIIDIVLYSNCLSITTSISKGAGKYFISNTKDVEAIITGVVKKHKYQLTNNFSSSSSRHIPDSVRREVWSRDQGQCVRCRAAEYLEFDHIIPHSKGGSNSINNVQLLCRKCNLYKSDRI